MEMDGEVAGAQLAALRVQQLRALFRQGRAAAATYPNSGPGPATTAVQPVGRPQVLAEATVPIGHPSSQRSHAAQFTQPEECYTSADLQSSLAPSPTSVASAHAHRHQLEEARPGTGTHLASVGSDGHRRGTTASYSSKSSSAAYGPVLSHVATAPAPVALDDVTSRQSSSNSRSNGPHGYSSRASSRLGPACSCQSDAPEEEIFLAGPSPVTRTHTDAHTHTDAGYAGSGTLGLHADTNAHAADTVGRGAAAGVEAAAAITRQVEALRRQWQEQQQRQRMQWRLAAAAAQEPGGEPDAIMHQQLLEQQQGWHSSLHTADVADELRPHQRNDRLVVGPTVGATAAAVGAPLSAAVQPRSRGDAAAGAPMGAVSARSALTTRVFIGALPRGLRSARQPAAPAALDAPSLRNMPGHMDRANAPGSDPEPTADRGTGALLYSFGRPAPATARTGPAAAAAAAGAAVAAAAGITANVEALLALASATGRRPHGGSAATSRLRRATPPGTAPRKEYAPSADPAFDSRLPVFMNTTNLPRQRPSQQRRRRSTGAAATGGAVATGVKAAGVAAAALRDPAGDAAAAAVPSAPRGTFLTDMRSESGSGGAPSEGASAGAASRRPSQAGSTAAGPLLWVSGEGAAGGTAAHGLAPAAECSAAGAIPEASHAGSAVARREETRAGCRPSSAPRGYTSARGRPAAPGGDRGAGAAAAAFPGRLVYDLLGQADVQLPDVRAVRPRPASAVMGRSRRGTEAPPGAADERPALEVRDTLLRKRVPSASFAAPSYRRRGASPQGVEGGGRSGDDAGDGRVQRRRAWAIPAEDAPARQYSPRSHEARGAGDGTRWPGPSSSPEPARSAAYTRSLHLGSSSPELGPRAMDAPINMWRRRSTGGRSRSCSRGRSRSRSGSAGIAVCGGTAGSGGGTGTDGEGERGSSAQRSRWTAQPERSVPAVRFSRAARFGGSKSDDEGVNERRARAAAAAAARRRRKSWAAAEGATPDDGGEAPAGAAPSPRQAHAPLQLDAAYRAVLPRGSAAVISATSRRLDWLPQHHHQQQRQRNPSRPRARQVQQSARTVQPPAQQQKPADRSEVGRPGATTAAPGGGGGGGWLSGGAAEVQSWLRSVPLPPLPERHSPPATSDGVRMEDESSLERRTAPSAAPHDADHVGPPRPGLQSQPQEAEARGQGAGRRRRREREGEAAPEPMAPLEGLGAALNAVRPRVQVAGFGHRSVAEGMRRELQARRERQLEKARQLAARLQGQTQEQLWPSIAAQLRRERLQRLGRRQRCEEPPPPGEEEQPQPRARTMEVEGGGSVEAGRGRHAGAGGSAAAASSAAASPERSASPGPPAPASPVAAATAGLPATAGTPSPGRGASPALPAQPTGVVRPDVASGPEAERPSPPEARESPGRRPEHPPPHYLALTRRTMAGLAAALDAAAEENRAADDPLVGVPSLLSPSYALIEKRAPAVAFSPSRSSVASPLRPSARYSRDPGPGHYEPERADGALSRITRSPAALFGTARRGVVPRGGDGGADSPTRHAAAGAAAAVAWLDRDAAAALDFTRRRAPAAVILPAPAPKPPAAIDEDDGAGLGPLEVRFTLVEPRVRGTPLMRAPPPVVVSDEDEGGVPLERLPADPWAIDAAIRPRRPAWGFESLGHADLAQRPAGRYLLDLRPVYDLVERRVQGPHDFARTPERSAGEAERARRLRRLPGAGDYDVDMAWAYLCKRAPQVLMRVAAPRWPPEPDAADRDKARTGPGSVAAGDDAEAEERQRRQALLELSQALDYIRPRPPAWSFAPLVRVVRRNAGPSAAARGRGFGPLLSWDVRISLVRRRLPGALPFGAGPPRQGLLDPRLLAAARHLAPGTYEVELAWRAALPAPRATDFARGTGHVLDGDEPPPPDDGGDLPYGARLRLEVAAAKDAVLSRRDRGPAPPMALALGRGEGGGAAADPAYAAPTAHLPLPDPGLDLPVRPRTRAAVFEGTPGHAPLVPEPSSHEALRGPGAYYPAGAEQALAAVGPVARATDFGRGPERGLLGDDRPSVEEVLEGNRLVLSPHTALDYVRPRAPAAVIPTAAANDPNSPANDMPYFHAVYDVEPGLGLALPRAPGAPGFGERPGRDPPLAWPAGLDPPPAPYGRAVGWLGPDDVSLTALAGFRRPPGAPDFAAMRPRTPPGRVDYDGQRLDLDPALAADRLRRQQPRPPNLALGRGHADPIGAPDPDWDLTAWLDYRPKLDAVRPHLVPPLAVPLGRQIGREQARRADPRVGEDATGDIDAGVYRVRHRLVWRSVPAIDFGRAASPPRSGLPPGALPADPDAGNVLMLEPRAPRGWRPALHIGRPWRQPFGRGEGRWERPGADPAYRFLAAVGDEGGALMLRHSADDLAALRRRATVANAPATAWGWMTARRDAQVMQPDPAQPPRPRLPPPAVPRVGTLLVQRLPPRDAELELIKAAPPNDPRVLAIRRRDRVLSRMRERILAQRAAVADV